MKLAVVASALVLGLVACTQGTEVGSSQAVASPRAATEGQVQASAGLPLVGGYAAQDPASTDSLAVQRQGERLLQEAYPTRDIRLTKLHSISSQVVAGTNFRLNSAYQDIDGTGIVDLEIFRSLQGEHSLSDHNYGGK